MSAIGAALSSMHRRYAAYSQLLVTSVTDIDRPPGIRWIVSRYSSEQMIS